MNRYGELEYSISAKNERVIFDLFFLSMFTVGTLSSIFMTWSLTVALLFFASIIAVYVNGGYRKLYVSHFSFAWLLIVLICFIASIHSEIFQDLYFYILSGVLVLSSLRFNRESLYKCFIIMIGGSIFFAIGVYLQFFSPSIYDKFIYPLFPAYYQEDIIRQYYRHKMCTGFNSETSISAEFMILGIISIYCIYPNIKQRHHKYAWLIGILLLFGILLTGKRSSLLFSITAFIYTIMKSAPHKQKINRILTILLISIVIATLLYFFLPNFILISKTRNTLVRIMEYASDDTSDITNNRLIIWARALEGFKEKPLFGKGWSWFKSQYGAGAHNIYFQLLCECGVFGATIVIFVLVYYFRLTHLIIKQAIVSENCMELSLAKFNIFSQTFILLYGITGNPLYNYSFFLWYVFAIIITVNLRKYYKTTTADVNYRQII